jgi:hypothetical protein
MKAILNRAEQILNNQSRLQRAIDASKKDRLRRKNQELREEIKNEANRGLGMLEDAKRMNFQFIYGCRPSTGVKANTTMIKDIFEAFIANADRINFMVLLPQA